MNKYLEALKYFKSKYNSFLKTKNNFCRVTISRESANEFVEEVEAVDNKLGKLEDLEDELGCPLEVVAQALSRGFYIDISKVEIDPPLKNPSGDLILINRPKDFRLNLWYERIEVASFGHYLEVYLKDYKTTWWLETDRSE